MHVIAQELAFLHIGSREFSVLGWFVEAFHEPFLLLMARHMEEKFEDDCSLSRKIYLYALRTRKSAGLMMRKLSVTELQRIAQFFGTSSRRKCRTARQKSL